MHAWEGIALVTGAIVNVIALLGGLWKLNQVGNHVRRTFDYFALEHELVMQDYCDRHEIKLSELPTRLQRAPWWGV